MLGEIEDTEELIDSEAVVKGGLVGRCGEVERPGVGWRWGWWGGGMWCCWEYFVRADYDYSIDGKNKYNCWIRFWEGVVENPFAR